MRTFNDFIQERDFDQDINEDWRSVLSGIAGAAGGALGGSVAGPVGALAGAALGGKAAHWATNRSGSLSQKAADFAQGAGKLAQKTSYNAGKVGSYPGSIKTNFLYGKYSIDPKNKNASTQLRAVQAGLPKNAKIEDIEKAERRMANQVEKDFTLQDVRAGKVDLTDPINRSYAAKLVAANNAANKIRNDVDQSIGTRNNTNSQRKVKDFKSQVKGIKRAMPNLLIPGVKPRFSLGSPEGKLYLSLVSQAKKLGVNLDRVWSKA